jgi:predicted nicotinamide N-methyase
MTVICPENMVEFAKNDSHFHRRRRALLSRIHRRYPTITEQIGFGEITIEFTRIADPDRVLDDVVAEEDRREKTTGVRLADPPHLPYWAELWDSAAVLARRFSREKILPDAHVLDLGCGMGLAGAAAAAMGARVLLGDLETTPLLLARLNTLPYADRADVRRLDWRVDRLDKQFDIILGSDIVYEKSQWAFLEPFFQIHLAPGGKILLGEPHRQTGQLFIPWIEQRNWQVTESNETALDAKRIRILELRREPLMTKENAI